MRKILTRFRFNFPPIRKIYAAIAVAAANDIILF